MRDNDLILKDKTIEETIDRCRQRIIANDENKTPNNNNIKFTIKQNKSEQQPKKLRHPNQSPNDGGETTKKLHTVSLEENRFEKVLVTHVDGASSCYVTPFENIDFKEHLMLRVADCIKTSKRGDLHKNLIYACNYDNTW